MEVLASDTAFWGQVAAALLKRFPVKMRELLTLADEESVSDAATQVLWNVAHNNGVEAWSWSVTTRVATFRPGLVLLARHRVRGVGAKLRSSADVSYLLAATGELHPERLASIPPSGEYAVFDIARLESNRELWRDFYAALADLVPDSDRTMRNDVRFSTERKATALLHRLSTQHGVDAGEWRIVSTYAYLGGLVCFQAMAPDGRRFYVDAAGVLRAMEPEEQAKEEESLVELQRPFIP